MAECLLECVPNVSEGRDGATIAALAAACGPALLDVHRDPDHHRSVFTLAGPDASDVATASRDLARAVADRIDVRPHAGVHPRLGALDVVPFVALGGDPAAAVTAATAFADWIATELAVPVFLYDAADPEQRTLPAVRHAAFRERGPDRGPATPHPTLGAVAVGARPPLVAVNCWLDAADPALARRIAREVRERDGGLVGLRALGLALPSAGASQVSMNVVDLDRCTVEDACAAVRGLVGDAGHTVTRVELVGLMPRAAYARCSAAFLAEVGWGPAVTVEGRREGA